MTPTTRTPAGTYTPVGTARTPAILPDWLATELQRTGHPVNQQPTQLPPPRTNTLHPARKHAHRLLEPLIDQVKDCAAVPEGTSQGCR
ncbi:hypothetical protein [Streptomyces sp. NPDC056255]|uniref:hypothetical protein n=1 Tax=Streptomyces sp. NPDC056255 TaxID=3345764 RepID=UPI0035D8ACCD